MLHAQLITSMLSSLDGDAEKNEKAERASNICFCCREDDVTTTASRVWERLRDEVSQNRSDRETLATCVGKFANSLAQVLFSWLQAQMRKRYHAG